MLNGYSDVMRIFTKILKPVYANSRQKGHSSVVFVDDSYLQGDTETECLGNVEAATVLLKYLGFTIHEVKSVFKPTQRIETLSFITDSTKMTVTISKDKMIAITNKISKLMATTFPTIRQLAFVIGSVVIFLLPAVSSGKLHYRALEKDKKALNISLKKVSGNFDKIVSIVLIKLV